MMQGSGNFAMDVYKDHLRNRQIIINGVIDDTMVEKVTLQILKFNEMDDEREQVDKLFDRVHSPVTLKISSPGGFIDPGLGIISQITQSDTPILTYAIGNCSSMAALILLSGHARFSSIYSRIMLHSLSSGYGGKLFDKIDDVNESKKLQKILDDITTSRTNIKQKQLDAMHLRREDWFMSSAEALELGVIDHVMPVGLKVNQGKRSKTAAAGKKK